MRGIVSIAIVCTLAACNAPSPPTSTTTPQATVETFATGAAFKGANGVYVGPDGNLYVASVITPGVFALSIDDGHVIKRLGPDDGVTNPDDIAFAPDGTLCWTDILDGDVGCRPPGGKTVVAAKLTPGVNPLTFSDDGRLFVSQCFFDTKLYEVDPKGGTAPRLIRDDLGPGCGLNGMDWGPDGMLYGPRWFRGEVIKVDVKTGDYSTVASGFGAPAAVKFDSKGRLHVLDTQKGEIVRIDGDAHTVVARLTPGMDNFAFAPDDRLFTSSFVDGYVAEVTSPTDVRYLTPAGVSMPGGVAVVGDALYVADFFALRRYDLASRAQTGEVRDVLGISELGTVISLHANEQGTLLLSSWNDRTIRVWDPRTDARMALWQKKGRPIDALRFAGEIVYSDFDAGSVASFAPETPDDETTRFTSQGVPAGLAVDGGALYVTQYRSGELLALADGGRWLAAAKTIASGLLGPKGVMIKGGDAYVVESASGTLAQVHLADGIVKRIANGLAVGTPAASGVPATMVFSGIAADAAGNFYVGGERDNLIHRIVPAR